MLVRTSVLWFVVATSGIAADAKSAQAPGSVLAVAAVAYSVHGTVVSSDGTPIRGAEIALLEFNTPSQYSRSDSGGHFRFDGITTSSPSIRVRRLGYQPRLVTVQITRADHSAGVFVTLDPRAAKLNAVNVDDDGGSSPDALLAGFYERARTNSFGHYIGPETFAKARPQWVSDAMRDVPGVVIKPTKRVGNSVRIRGCGVPGESPEAVGPLVWLDGVRMPGAELDDVAQAADVAALEIYNSFAGIPAQFFDRTAVCGTILVWTRSR